MAKKKGRGQLSSLDTLPEWAEDAKLEAYAALKARKLTQEEILDGFNAAIREAARAIGVTEKIPQISRSAFNRAALKQSILGRSLADTSAIAAALAPKLDEVGDDKVTLLIAETMKAALLEMFMNAGELKADGESAKLMAYCARAIKDLEATKQLNAKNAEKIEARLKSVASKRVDQLAGEAGLSADQVKRIRRDVLGVRT